MFPDRSAVLKGTLRGLVNAFVCSGRDTKVMSSIGARYDDRGRFSYVDFNLISSLEYFDAKTTGE
jgi:hypothetical protein